MTPLIFFITGTGTGVGKTVFARELAKHLRAAGFSVGALKPICAGGRDDARELLAALSGALTLEEINPWHFRAPLAPLLAARRENKVVSLAAVVAHVEQVRRRFSILIIEGAGGLLSPLGEGFDSRDLILELRAIPIVVCPNQLGALNQVRLVLAALPMTVARQAKVVLSSPARADSSCRGNVSWLTETLGAGRVFVLPRISTRRNGRVVEMLKALLKSAKAKR